MLFISELYKVKFTTIQAYIIEQDFDQLFLVGPQNDLTKTTDHPRWVDSPIAVSLRYTYCTTILYTAVQK